ncbi:hypothetical protein AB3S75_042782 [Citrus x aurantiifolia]
MPCSSLFAEFLRKDCEKNFHLDDDSDDDGDEHARDLDEGEIRSSIGLDSTLDNEVHFRNKEELNQNIQVRRA